MVLLCSPLPQDHVPTEAPSAPPRVADVFVRMRWGDAPTCPFCDHASAYVLSGRSVTRPRFKCAGCRRQFSVTKSTILEGSHQSLETWWRLVHVLGALDEDVSVGTLERRAGLGRTAARNILARLSYAAARPPLRPALRRGADGTARLRFDHLAPRAILAALLATPAPTDSR